MPRACAGSAAGASKPPSGAGAVSGAAPGASGRALPSAAPSGAFPLDSGMRSAATELLDSLDQSGDAAATRSELARTALATSCNVNYLLMLSALQKSRCCRETAASACIRACAASEMLDTLHGLYVLCSLWSNMSGGSATRLHALTDGTPGTMV